MRLECFEASYLNELLSLSGDSKVHVLTAKQSFIPLLQEDFCHLLKFQIDPLKQTNIMMNYLSNNTKLMRSLEGVKHQYNIFMIQLF